MAVQDQIIYPAFKKIGVLADGESPTSTMEKLNSLTPGKSKWAQYAYLMLTYKPNFFNSDKH